MTMLPKKIEIFSKRNHVRREKGPHFRAGSKENIRLLPTSFAGVLALLFKHVQAVAGCFGTCSIPILQCFAGSNSCDKYLSIWWVLFLLLTLFLRVCSSKSSGSGRALDRSCEKRWVQRSNASFGIKWSTNSRSVGLAFDEQGIHDYLSSVIVYFLYQQMVFPCKAFCAVISICRHCSKYNLFGIC